MSVLEHRPIAHMFWKKVPISIAKPLTLSFIETRLREGLYQSADAWASDVRSMFMSVLQATPEGSLTNCSARQLMTDFERELTHLSPSLSPHILPLQLAEDTLQHFLRDSLPPFIPHQPLDSEPAAELFNASDQEFTTEQVIERIRFLSSSSLILRVIAFLYQRQPEALQIGTELVIMFALLSKETLRGLSRFVSSLLREAAAGRVPSFIPTPGTVQRPVITL
jgi:hypothetical protein